LFKIFLLLKQHKNEKINKKYVKNEGNERDYGAAN
jgi:hypothetical protein